MAEAKSDVVAIVGVPLPRAGWIAGAKIGGRYVFEFLLVRVPPIEPGVVAEVVVNTGAILVRIVATKARCALTAMLDLLLDWAPDAATRARILVDNPARLYGF